MDIDLFWAVRLFATRESHWDCDPSCELVKTSVRALLSPDLVAKAIPPALAVLCLCKTSRQQWTFLCLFSRSYPLSDAAALMSELLRCDCC
jgi:hypothetical protein